MHPPFRSVRVHVLALKEPLPEASVVIEGAVLKLGSRWSWERTLGCGGMGHGPSLCRTTQGLERQLHPHLQ
jgi:hypothetical protein